MAESGVYTVEEGLCVFCRMALTFMSSLVSEVAVTANLTLIGVLGFGRSVVKLQLMLI